MTTLLASRPASEHRTTVQAAEPARVDRPGDDAAPPALRRQVTEWLRSSGFMSLDLRLFIAGYFLVVLGATVLCVAARIGNPQAWAWGVRLMNLPLAAVGAGLLVLATVSAGAAVCFSAGRSRWWTGGALALTTLLCLGFIATLAIDLDTKWAYGIRPGDKFRPYERYVAHRFNVRLPKKRPAEPLSAAPAVAAAPLARKVDPAKGQKLFLGTCMSCHGPRGEGLPGQGKSLVNNEFIGSLDEDGLLAFLKAGRQPWDPKNTTKVQMPPRGGNPMLSDDDLRDIAAHLRTLQSSTASAAPAPSGAAATNGQHSEPLASAAESSAAAASAFPEPIDPALLLPRWVVGPPPAGTPGLSAEFLADASRPKWKPPSGAVAFVNSYYLVAQYGGLHASAIAIVFAVLAVQAIRGRISAERRAPLALGLVACTVMTASWLVLFPFTFVI